MPNFKIEQSYEYHASLNHGGIENDLILLSIFNSESNEINNFAYLTETIIEVGKIHE